MSRVQGYKGLNICVPTQNSNAEALAPLAECGDEASEEVITAQGGHGGAVLTQ